MLDMGPRRARSAGMPLRVLMVRGGVVELQIPPELTDIDPKTTMGNFWNSEKKKSTVLNFKNSFVKHQE